MRIVDLRVLHLEGQGFSFLRGLDGTFMCAGASKHSKDTEAKSAGKILGDCLS